MQAYTGFAESYDKFMDNVPYDSWTEYLSGLLKEYGIDKGIVAELGCGTGSMTRRLQAKGFDMIGIDFSEEMLGIARSKSDGDILYLNQDMREFELFGTAAAIVSICDSINYITEEEELLQVFQLVNNYLDKDGVFIFDLNTEYYYKKVLGDGIFAENREDCSFIWENFYDEEAQENEYDITIYQKIKDTDTFVRMEETHIQRAYDLEKVQELIEASGLKFIAMYDAGTKQAPSIDSSRVYFIAQECYQDGKKYE